MNDKTINGLGVGPVEDHREREGGALVYPVYSRRSGGLSVGVNLFPDEKRCSFDCPYCEVFPFRTNCRFSVERMEEDLREVLGRVRETGGVPVRDICFSGNGEPTMSPDFAAALKAAAAIRAELVPQAKLVLITNGTGLLDGGTFDLLRRYARGPEALVIWLKLDAGTESWYRAMARSAVPFAPLVGQIRAFTAAAPVIIQTMLCYIEGNAPPEAEALAWERLVVELAQQSAGADPTVGLREVQLYGKVRPAPDDPLTGKLPAPYLESRRRSLEAALDAAGLAFSIPVKVY
jgi:histidinol dehydrogenase